MSAFPLKVLFDFVDGSPATLQGGVTVSSRNFKKAFHRNRVKRLLREAYRLQKLPLQQALQNCQKSMILFFIYTGKELPVYEEVFKKMGILLTRLVEALPIAETKI